MTSHIDTVAICRQPVFIVGSPRSGTSILAWSLARHPGFWVSAESFILENLYGNRHAERAYQASSFQAHNWLTKEGVDRAEYLRYLGVGVNALFTSRSGGKRWIDQTPTYTPLVDLLASMFPDALFLHILRDGRQVVHSMTHFDKVPRSGDRTAHMPKWASDFSEACKTWSLYTDIAMDFSARFADRCLTVRHDRLVQGPGAEFAVILQFLDADQRDEPALYFDSHSINSSFPGETHADRTAPWVQWSNEERTIFCSIAGDTLIRAGLAAPSDLIVASMERDR